jgi:arylsulfatase A-like enzyme
MKNLSSIIYFIVLLSLSMNATEKPMNILFIGVDDLRTELGCYGSVMAKTPNIDQLAQQGTLFEHAYVQQSVCSASRASFLSGLRPDTTGADYPYSTYFVNTILKKHLAISPYFHSKGYYTRNLGKIHHGYREHLTENSWEPPFTPHYTLPENIKAGKKYKNGRGPETPAYEKADFPDHIYKDGKTTLETIATLERIHNKGSKNSFFLAVGYLKPHLPFVAPKKYWDMYDPNNIHLPKNDHLPMGGHKISISNGNLKKYKCDFPTETDHLDKTYARTLTHAYLACVSFIDAQVGLLMKKLEQLGYAENTIIVFWSDHGYHLGHQGQWGKTTNFENATRSPLIIKDPRYPSSQRCKALVEYVDLYPTLLDLSGHDIPDHLEGTSMKPLLQDPHRPWKKAAFSQFPRGKSTEGYAIRTDRYRYVEWYRIQAKTGKKTELLYQELYDHQNDSAESINLAKRPEHQNIVEGLSAQLKAGWKSALPNGVVNRSNHPLAPPAVKYRHGKE